MWTLQDSNWRALDHYEGVAGGYYERIELEVEQVADSKLVKCPVYLSCTISMVCLLLVTIRQWSMVPGR